MATGFFAKRRRQRELHAQMEAATTHSAWREAAEALDALEGNDAWIADDHSHYFDHELIRARIQQMERCRREDRPLELIEVLEEGLNEHLHDVVNPRLYGETFTGENKAIARALLKEAVDSLEYLIDEPHTRSPAEVKLERIQKAYHRFGRSALMLSGGATLGIYHLGVVKALHDHGVLPSVISGSSMGAIVAAGICTRSAAELDAFLHDPRAIHRDWRRLEGLRTIAVDKAVFDPGRLLTHIDQNLGGDLTFKEAWEKTGMNLNISVAPTRSRQKPKILNHVTTPDLLISWSALASCAMPFLFKPGVLMTRGEDGEPAPYLPKERWIDGTMGGDLPMARVSRLHNVNHFIVSQTNPHVFVFASKKDKSGLGQMALDLTGSLLHSQATAVVSSMRQYTNHHTVRPMLDQLHGLMAQPYVGDINLHPRTDLGLMRNIVSNPTLELVERFILEGERVTWPRLAMIRDQTLISRTFESILKRLEARLLGDHPGQEPE